MNCFFSGFCFLSICSSVLELCVVSLGLTLCVDFGSEFCGFDLVLSLCDIDVAIGICVFGLVFCVFNLDFELCVPGLGRKMLL